MNTSLSLKHDNSNLLLKKLLELKKTISTQSLTTQESRSDLRSSKSDIASLEEFPTDTQLDSSINSNSKIELIRSQIIGLRTLVKSPFGFQLETLYADHTATNRPYESVEDVIKYAKYLAANPHT